MMEQGARAQAAEGGTERIAAGRSALDGKAQAERAARHVARLFSGRFAIHAPIHLTALVSLVLGLAVSSLTGVSVDTSIILRFGTFLAAGFFIVIMAAILWRFVQLALFDRQASPAREIARLVGRIVSDRDRLGNGAHFFTGFFAFAAGFSALKPSIAILNPFSWDVFFRDLDRIVHFGRLPHEWLGFVTASPAAVQGFNIVYNLWFFVLLAALFTAGLSKAANGPAARLRLRFILSFMLTWFVAGFLIATGFSSAGPCYFERIGAGSDYAGLMADLHAANAVHPIWALSTQEMLWEGFSGLREGSSGISAFPSLHVATSTLIAIAAWQVNRWLGLAAILFAIAIQFGSVVLAWHYAVDGYAGALLAYGLWGLSARLIPAGATRHGDGTGSAQATNA